MGLNCANIVVAINGSINVIKNFDTYKPECQKVSDFLTFFCAKDPIGIL